MSIGKIMKVVLLLIAVLSACTRSYPVVQPPVREADIYPGAQKIADLTVAVDEISNPERTRQYFGVDLTREDILPVMIVFTNHGDSAFLVKSSDVLLLEGGEILMDPMPMERIEKFVKGGLDLAFTESIVAAHGSYRGVLFYKVRKKPAGLVGKVERLLLERLKMTVVVTDRNSGERIHFGPFAVSGPRD